MARSSLREEFPVKVACEKTSDTTTFQDARFGDTFLVLYPGTELDLARVHMKVSAPSVNSVDLSDGIAYALADNRRIVFVRTKDEVVRFHQ